MPESAQLDPALAEGNGLCQRTAHGILSLPGFDHIMGFIIVVNMAVMIIDINESAIRDEGGDDQIMWTDVFGWVVLAIFVLELLARLVAYQWIFFNDPWNVGDLVVVTVDVGFSLVGLVAEEMFPVSILRVFRLAKLARVSKLLRVFTELRLLLAGLVSSMRAIFWGTVLVGLFLLVWAMMAVLLIHPLAKDVDFDGCPRCPRAYSSVWQACLTFWQQIVTGDSWGQATIPVIEHYPATVLFFGPVFLSIGLAVMNLILGVVVSVAQSSYDKELEELQTAKELAKLEHERNLNELCNQMDTDSNGVLSRQEIHTAFTSEGEFRNIMLDLGITDDDFEVAWGVLDADKSGSVSHNEFVSCLCKMKKSDAQFMITYIKYYITWMKGALLQQIDRQHSDAQNIQKQLQAVEEQEASILHEQDLILNKSQAYDVIEEQEPARHGEENKNRPAICSTCDESDLPEQTSRGNALTNTHGYLRHLVGSTTSKELTSASADSALQACLQEVSEEIQVMRSELKFSLKDLDRRLCQQLFNIQSKQQVVPGVMPSRVPEGESNMYPQKVGESALDMNSMSSYLQQQAAGLSNATNSDLAVKVILI